jgi:hypothetical protein
MCVICGTSIGMGYENCVRGTALVEFFESDFEEIRSAKGKKFCRKCAHLSDDDFNVLKVSTLVNECQSAKLGLERYVLASRILYDHTPQNLALLCLEFLGDGE